MQILQDLTRLRQDLHRWPELSHREKATQQRLKDFLAPFGPQEVLSLSSGKALLFSFESGREGPHWLFRADLDALPISELKDKVYSSEEPEVSHKCGHDGHMALVASIAEIWQNLANKKGKLGLLFQHAEETGEGAQEVCKDPLFQQWNPSRVFGFHNIPGAPLGQVILSQPIFACASTGVRIGFKGESAHAAEPSKAKSALNVIPELLHFAKTLHSVEQKEDFLLITPIHIQIGNENFGITPSDGQICFTLRSQYDAVLEKGIKDLRREVRKLANAEGLHFTWELVEPFPALTVDESSSRIVKEAALNAQLPVQERSFPFLWSEDFGYFTQKYPGTYFGIGIGENRPGLHHPEYDFNDEALEPFYYLLRGILTLGMEQ